MLNNSKHRNNIWKNKEHTMPSPFCISLRGHWRPLPLNLLWLAVLRQKCLGFQQFFENEVFLHNMAIVSWGTGYETLQVSKAITKVLQFMLKVLRPCTIFCFAFAHYGWITSQWHFHWFVAHAKFKPIVVVARSRLKTVTKT